MVCKDLFYRWFLNPHNIKVDGYCPRQATGNLKDGRWFYFRARGTNVSMEFRKDEFGPIISRVSFAKYAEWPQCGYLPEWECIKLANSLVNMEKTENQTRDKIYESELAK